MNGSSGAAQGHSVIIKGYQLQSGQSSGSATAQQLVKTTINAGGTQTNGTTELQQTTQGQIELAQQTSTTDSAYLMQTQSNRDVIFHFQVSIKNGPSIQNQMAQIHSYQFTSTVSK